MAARQKILIVDNDVNVAERIALYLNKELFDTIIRQDIPAALKELSAADLVLLDLTTPAMDNLQGCRRIRAVSHIPLIILSSKNDVFDKVLGLEMGADDYISKPFDTRELTAKVRALLRRSDPSYYAANILPAAPASTSSKIVKYPDLVINLSNYTVICDGHHVDMPPKEIELLYFLASSPDQVFTREQLLNQIWGYDFSGDTRTVDVHIKRIREKLKEHHAWNIHTVWGVGYRFHTVSV